MPIDTTRNECLSLATHTVHGRIVRDEMYGVLEDSFVQHSTRLMLWDLSDAQATHIKPEMLQRFVARSSKLGADRTEGKTAIVAPNDLTFGLARMSGTYTEMEEAPYEMRVFRKFDDALAWLLEDMNEGLGPYGSQ
ncbi:MAG: hypothetical protein KDI19_06675 [Pseudomonadales bacterium]|nr:hypothetical protein [Pseudomonadales bacterium]